jgi:hypothetical protein
MAYKNKLQPVHILNWLLRNYRRIQNNEISAARNLYSTVGWIEIINKPLQLGMLPCGINKPHQRTDKLNCV